MQLSNTGGENMRVRDGFTLLELVVVLCIVGIVLAVSLPRMGAILARSPLEGGATAISAELRLAQAMAGRQRQPIRISIDTVNRVLRLRDFDTPATIYSQRWFNDDSEFPLNRFSANDSMVLVYPNGTTDGALTFELRAGDQERSVMMTRAGLIRVTE